MEHQQLGEVSSHHPHGEAKNHRTQELSAPCPAPHVTILYPRSHHKIKKDQGLLTEARKPWSNYLLTVRRQGLEPRTR
jgi:hypothetical protein